MNDSQFLKVMDRTMKLMVNNKILKRISKLSIVKPKIQSFIKPSER